MIQQEQQKISFTFSLQFLLHFFLFLLVLSTSSFPILLLLLLLPGVLTSINQWLKKPLLIIFGTWSVFRSYSTEMGPPVLSGSLWGPTPCRGLNLGPCALEAYSPYPWAIPSRPHLPFLYPIISFLLSLSNTSTK